MSEFHVEVVRVGPVQKHENADTLSITLVNGGYPVIFRTGDLKEGDLAVYIPIDSIVPDTRDWEFLKGHRRIKAKRLRGVFSMGMLHPIRCSCPDWFGGTHQENEHCPMNWHLSKDVQAEMKIEKWEPTVHGTRLSYADHEADQPWFPKYTDIEGLRRWGSILQPGEEVVLTEKIHGANGRWCWRDDRLWTGSHNHLKKVDERDLWWRALNETGLEAVVKRHPGFAFYGEVHGNVQDLKYGLQNDIDVRIFDVLDTTTLRYLDYDDMISIIGSESGWRVPLLYRGPWSEDLRAMAEGKTTLGGDHVREGFVVKPVHERFDMKLGRVILKLVGEGYLLRKEA